MRPRRAILTITAIVLVVLFVAPIRSYRAAQEHLVRARSELARAKSEERQLARALDRSGSREALVQQARALGYVFPGETAYVVVTP